MGFMDNFTSDSPVTVKQPDYYAMVKGSSQNGVNHKCGQCGSAGVLHPGNDYREKAGFS